jgi:hypothetical protein
MIYLHKALKFWNVCMSAVVGVTSETLSQSRDLTSVSMYWILVTVSHCFLCGT